MTVRMITRRGVPVQPRNRFEFWAWLFMRVSGLVLLFMAVFHFLYMHFFIQVDTINFDLIAFRWRNPFWRVYDFALLAFGFTHGMNGMRVVLEDYTPRRLRRPVMFVLLVAYVTLIALGAWIVLTFQTP